MAFEASMINRWALICLIIEKLGENAQCGETRIQKAVYLAKEMLGIELPEFDFTIYRYGPYSEEIGDDLYMMENWGVVHKKKEKSGFSYVYEPDEHSVSKEVLEQCKNQHAAKIGFLASVFDTKSAGEISRLATAYWVNTNNPDKSEEQRAEKLHETKPHLSMEVAKQAIVDAEKIAKDARKECLPSA